MDKSLDIQNLSISDARAKLTKLPDEIEGKEKVIKVTSNKQPVLALMSWAFFENIVETLEILSDKELMNMLDKSKKESKEGKGISWDEAKKGLTK